MRIFLSGLMGSGKSEVARRVAQRAGLPLVDLDDLVASKAGLEISEIFQQSGEPVFRAMEQEAAREVLATYPRCVVALGGGTVVHKATRRALLEAGLVVTLEAHPRELAQRVGEGRGRPLLEGQQVEERLQRLMAERAASYAECHVKLDTSDQAPGSVAEQILEAARQPPIVVPLGIYSQRVEVGQGVIASLGRHVGDSCGPKGVVVLVTETSAAHAWVDQVREQAAASGRRVVVHVLPAGQAPPTLRAVQRLWDAVFCSGANRGSLLIGVGGHRVAAVTGFAAATLFNGLALGIVPSTLEAMAESGIRGESGVATRRDGRGVGVQHQPKFSVSDIDALRFLPASERRAGLGELVKSAWLDGERAVSQLEMNAPALLAGENRETSLAVRMSVELGARLVSQDGPERRQRALLDLGWPFGRALAMAARRRRLRRGHAISLGMVAASRVAVAMGRTTREQAERLQRLLRALRLPVELDDYLGDRASVRRGLDSGGYGGHIDLAIPGAPGEVAVVGLGAEELLRMLWG